jgi:ABC-2 type transport system permease protein
VITLTAMRLEAKTEKIGDRGPEGAGGLTSIFFGYAIAFLLYMMIAIYGQNILRGVMEEKTTRVAEVVVSSVKTDILLAGKVLGVGSVALTQVLVWVAIGGALYTQRGVILEKFGVPAAASAGGLPSVSPGVAVALLLFFILGFIFYAALFAAVGAMVNNQEDAQQAAMPVMLLLITSIVFMNPTLLNPSSTMAKVTSWLPWSAPILMPLRMAMSGVPWLEITAVLAGVAVSAGAAIWLSARIYRVGLLMYGKRPTIAELVRWVRMA